MKIYNSLSRKIEEFEPLNPPKVGIYTCGPTVYFYPHIGNWRTFVLGDLVVRAMKYLGYEVEYVMNITDVGHLTGDNLGDASSGEDRLEKAAKRENKTAWDVARFYTEDFLESYSKLNMTRPKIFSKATDHINEQIELVKRIEEAGFTYKITDGVYFDIGKYESEGNRYGLMSNIHMDNTEARIAENEEKRDSRDFALWKFSGEERRQMEWDSPWGKGFPGWHIECSAMSMKYLGEQFDIHVGGEDHKSTHHPNEVAQSEAATGKKPFVKYWLHGAFLQVDGGRMGKSLGNAYNLHDIEEKGFSPLDLRYFYLTANYRDKLNFTWEALEGAARGYDNMKKVVAGMKGVRNSLSEEKLDKIDVFSEKFKAAIENDLNMPQALAVVWEVLKSNVPTPDKLDLVLSFDQVLGLKLDEVEAIELKEYKLGSTDKIAKANIDLGDGVLEKLRLREEMKESRDFGKADELRDEIVSEGYELQDSEDGPLVKKK